jgi:hypothetical protein
LFVTSFAPWPVADLGDLAGLDAWPGYLAEFAPLDRYPRSGPVRAGSTAGD